MGQVQERMPLATHLGWIIFGLVDVNSMQNEIVRRINALELQFGRSIFLQSAGDGQLLCQWKARSWRLEDLP